VTNFCKIFFAQDIMPTNLDKNLQSDLQTSFPSSSDTPQISDQKDMEVNQTDQVGSDVDTNTIQINTGSKSLKKGKRFSIGRIISLILIIVSIGMITTGSYLAYQVLALNDSSFGQGENQDLFAQLGQIGNLLNPNKRVELKGEKDGRTNFLLLGKDVTGPGLTDSIMIFSYFYKEKKAATVNIPRDLWVYDGYGQFKINALYSYAEGRRAGSGEQALANFLSREFGIDIHYWASTNFQGLRQLVDALGGIEVEVDKSFTDCLYPTDNYSGFVRPCPSFTKGKTRMDGKTALQYSRSRETTSDFDRSRRQSIVVQAILQKAKSQNIFESVSKINSYLEILGKNFRTSLRLDELYSLAQLLRETDIQNNFFRAQWETGNGFLCPGQSQDGAYIIWYCDNAIPGRQGTSRYRNMARDFIQNLLAKTEFAELFDASVVFLGNQSTDTNKALDEFSKLGFTDLKINNAYARIPRATSTSKESITIYITDEKTANQFEKMSPKPNLEYTLKREIPAEVVVPSAYKDSKIIVWVS
jgi:LCP family protein required for cell wall assembly